MVRFRCAFLCPTNHLTEACDIGGQASATNGLSDATNGLSDIKNAPCNRPLRGRLHIQILVQIGVRITLRFGAHPISHTIRIGAYFKFVHKSEWLYDFVYNSLHIRNWTRFNFLGNIIFAFLFREMSFLPSLT
jgi:hypothetical protein